MGASPDDVAAGHAFYTRRSLRVYDAAILGFFSRAAWRCPSARILEHYDRHVSGVHLDIGVGTGFFLDRCRYPVEHPDLTLLDPNTACLTVAARRLARYAPAMRLGDILQPLPDDIGPFDSIALNYVLHCLPGSMADKAVVFAHTAARLRPGGVVFGATLLHDGVHRGWFARQVMRRNNEHRIFSNEHDSLEGLRAALATHLVEPAIEVVGCVALFAGQGSEAPG